MRLYLAFEGIRTMPNQDDVCVYTRRTGESQKAFAAYCEYRDMGAERSLANVGQKIGKKKANLERWSSRWDWVARSAAYDADLAAKEKAAKDFALKAEAEKWAKRKLELLEQDWQEAEALGKRLDQMMTFPLQTVERKQTRTSEDGKTIINNYTTIKPAGWTYREVINGLALVWRMRRVAVGLTTGNTTTTVQETGTDGAVVVEDIESVRDRRWQAAMPGLMRLMRKELGQVGDGDDANSSERREP